MSLRVRNARRAIQGADRVRAERPGAAVIVFTRSVVINTLAASALIHLACVFACAADATTLAAKVGPETISIAEVRHEMQNALRDRKLADDEREVLEAQTLGLLVNRQL